MVARSWPSCLRSRRVPSLVSTLSSRRLQHLRPRLPPDDNTSSTTTTTSVRESILRRLTSLHPLLYILSVSSPFISLLPSRHPLPAAPNQPLRHAVDRSGSSGAAGVRYHDGDHVRACTALRFTLIFSIIASASSTTAFAAANCPIGACLTKSNASRHGKQTLLNSCPLH